ncbi:MAG: Sec-dependent nitrous-oxide reductase [Bacteroidetes bacterium]|nr:Sec-dependent nitrous-oxide reductase [Bacteroidota bacterium]MBU1580470.1 Sec-dependent nitrous-oxide reductase [Bacteroidota bacterium]MBU2558883.1 Sec-dependent nitrous-oxide reductase [Bacteroidota bacterium]
MKKYSFKYSPDLLLTVIVVAALALMTACDTKGDKKAGATGAPYGEESFGEVVKRRGLNADDVLAAAKTYTPDKLKDEYIALNSGGQAGNMIMYTVPSMRMTKYVPTSSRQPVNGFGYSVESEAVLKSGYIDGQVIDWGDTHHPGFSETNGNYDGKWAVVNDKANPRVFVVSLKDWELKQTVNNPIFRSNHGGCFFTPNSDYIGEASQYPAPLDRKYYPLTESNFKKYWRGGLTYWKFDNEIGKIDEDKSFTMEFPPYTQDLTDMGKLVSDGWSFTNSFCTEMYYGGIESGRPPFEAGCSSRDVDYLHVVNWKKAAELIKNRNNYKIINGHKVIPIDVAVANNILFLIPEPKSPHGVDVSPDGKYIIVAGKLDSHAWVYSWDKITKAIADKNFESTDHFGIPVISLETALHGSVEVGLGPLHNQYDKEPGVVYTSIYVDSRITKWDYVNLKVLDFVSSHYNVGHLVAAHGDVINPHGKYLISLNKLSIDRFNPVGPLHPQNHQLIDIEGDKMSIIYDMPLPMGEPHYTALISVNDFESIETYPVGTNIYTMEKSPYYTELGSERMETQGKKVHVFATINEGVMKPGNINLEQGQEVEIHITNHGQTKLDHYVYEISAYDQMYRWRPGETATLAFKAERAGMYPLLLDNYHSPEGRSLQGYLSVRHNEAAENERLLAYSKRVQTDMQMQSFQPSAIEMKNLLEGEMEFLNYGCNACHRFGEDFNGPDLLMVDKRRTEDWLKSWIMNPEEHMNEADIEAMRQRYKLAMPDQNVSEEDVAKIITYLKLRTTQFINEQ